MERTEILQLACNAVLEMDEDLAQEALEAADAIGLPPLDLLTQGFCPGIRELGEQFGRGEIFLPELIFGTEIMQLAASETEKRLAGHKIAAKATLVIGTVEGDIHDIGKGIVAALVRSNGIEVIDLGREVPAQAFVEAIRQSQARFLGSSALLTTTMPVQEEIEAQLREAGLREQVLTLVGGAPVTQDWADSIGADCYCRDASDTVDFILSHLGNR